MDYYKVPENVLSNYILGCLLTQEKFKFQGDIKTGFLGGIDDGVNIADGEEGLTGAMKKSINGLRESNIKFGLGNYPCPDKKKIDSERFEYMQGYLRGLIDSLEIITFYDAKNMAKVHLQDLGLA